MISRVDGSFFENAKQQRSDRESKGFGKKNVQQMQSDPPQGRGSGVVREHQA
jgi:hypothetical protein